LGDARRQVNAHCLDNDLANEVPLGFSVPIFRRKARFKDDVDCGTNVYLVYLSVDRHANVLLLSMEQDGKRGGPGGRVGRTEFARRDAVVRTMLREEGGEVAIDERTEIHGERPGLDGAEDGRKDAGDFEEELFVVARDLCPPRVYVRAKGEGYEIVELRI
jgi:hypothetical protein